MGILLRAIVIIFLFTAEHAAANPPEIESHSKRSFAFYKGDVLRLHVKAKGENVRYKWVLNDETICSQATCDIQSKDWGIGKHTISLIVFNDDGSKYIQFVAKVLSRPSGLEITTLTPPLMISKQIKSIISTDIVATKIKGLSYRYSEQKTNIIGFDPVLLEWNEKLKTKKFSQLKIHKKNSEEHHLLGSSVVNTYKTEDGRRILLLKHGEMRSRSLSPQAPFWSILTESGIQIDTNASGDVIVSHYPRKSYTEITSIRGFARVFIHEKVESNANHSGKELLLKPGSSILIKKDRIIEDYIPNVETIGEIIMNTTPPMMIKEELNDKAYKSVAEAEYDFSPATNLTESIQRSNTLLENLDAYQALAILLPHINDGLKNYNYLLNAGLASDHILLYDQATEFYFMAMDLDKSKPESFFHYGVMMLKANHWQDAIASLNDAKNLRYKDSGTLDFYLATAHYHNNNHVIAKKLFTHIYWNTSNSFIKSAAEQFLNQINEDSAFNLKVTLGYQADNNLFHLSDNQTHPVNEKVKAGSGLWANIDIYGRLLKLGQFQWDLDLQMESLSYQDIDMKDSNIFFYQAFMSLQWFFGASKPKDALFSLGFSPRFHSFSLGNDHLQQSMGGKVFLKVNGIWSKPELYYLSEDRQDPLQKNGNFDPHLWEFVSTTDRKHKYAGMGLNMSPYEHNNWNVQLKLFSGVSSYKAVPANPDSFINHNISILFNYPISLRQFISLKLNHTIRDFYNREEKEEDGINDMMIDWRWRYSPNLSHLLTLQQTSQTSSRIDRDFSNFKTRFALALDF